MPMSQRCWRPDAHQKQRPQDGMNDDDHVVAHRHRLDGRADLGDDAGIPRGRRPSGTSTSRRTPGGSRGPRSCRPSGDARRSGTSRRRPSGPSPRGGQEARRRSPRPSMARGAPCTVPLGSSSIVLPLSCRQLRAGAASPSSARRSVPACRRPQAATLNRNAFQRRPTTARVTGRTRWPAGGRPGPPRP